MRRPSELEADNARLLNSVGAPDTCPHEPCQQPIWWVVWKNGQRVAYNADLTEHSATTCAAVSELRQQKEAARAANR